MSIARLVHMSITWLAHKSHLSQLDAASVTSWWKMTQLD